MKKQILLMALISLFSVSAFAQKLTADEMLSKMNCETFGCISDFILSKGYSFSSSVDSAAFSQYIYLSEQGVSNAASEQRTKNILGFGFLKSQKATDFLDIGTADKAYYQELLKQFKSKSFAEYKAGSYKVNGKNSGVTQGYKSAKYPKLYLYVSLVNTGSWTDYHFKLTQEKEL